MVNVSMTSILVILYSFSFSSTRSIIFSSRLHIHNDFSLLHPEFYWNLLGLRKTMVKYNFWWLFCGSILCFHHLMKVIKRKYKIQVQKKQTNKTKKKQKKQQVKVNQPSVKNCLLYNQKWATLTFFSVFVSFEIVTFIINMLSILLIKSELYLHSKKVSQLFDSDKKSLETFALRK